MSDTDQTVELEAVASIEAGPSTYLIRRGLVLLATAAVVVTAGGLAAGAVPTGWSPSGSTSVSASPEDATTTDSATPLLPEVVRDAYSPAAPGAGGEQPSTGSETGAGTSPEVGPAAPGGQGDDASTESLADAEPAVPDRASRFVAQSPRRVVDTRTDDGAEASPDTPATFSVATDRTAVALSISVLGATREGSVLVDGRAGVVEAITIGKPGTTTTNLVFVPTVGPELTIRSTAGGHLVADVVGTFAPSGPAPEGRFVAIAPHRITELETEVDGREAVLGLDDVPGAAGASALLVSVTADVGTDGGVVRLGDEADDYDQMLMWAPALDDDRERRGLAIVEPTPAGLAALRYDGGARLTVDVLGYFTGRGAPSDTAGLFVPSGPRLLAPGADGSTADGAPIEPRARAAVVTVGSRSAIAGQLGSLLVPVDEGALALGGPPPEDAIVTLLGVFLR